MAKAMEIEVNGKHYAVSYPADTPLLDVLRDELSLTGTKYGCGEGQCGACTVLIGGAPKRSCQIPVSAAVAKPVTTIEGLEKEAKLNPVRRRCTNLNWRVATFSKFWERASRCSSSRKRHCRRKRRLPDRGRSTTRSCRRKSPRGCTLEKTA